MRGEKDSEKGRVIVLRNYSRGQSAGQGRRAGECLRRFGLARLGVLELADVVDNSLAEAVDVHPRAVPDTVAGCGYVDHVALAARCSDTVGRLLIGDDDDAVVALVHGVEGSTQVSSLVQLARLHRIAQSESAPGRDAPCRVREGVDGYLLG